MRPVAMYSQGLGFVPSAHYAEYLAFLRGMELAKTHGATGLFARADALGMVRHLDREEIAGGEGIDGLTTRIEALRPDFVPFTLRWAPGTHRKTRGDGVQTADLIAKRASGVGGGLLGAGTP